MASSRHRPEGPGSRRPTGAEDEVPAADGLTDGPASRQEDLPGWIERHRRRDHRDPGPVERRGPGLVRRLRQLPRSRRPWATRGGDRPPRPDLAIARPRPGRPGPGTHAGVPPTPRPCSAGSSRWASTRRATAWASACPAIGSRPSDLDDLIAYLRVLGTEPAPGILPETIRIGTLLPPSGSARELREIIADTLRAAVADLNERGGIYQRRIELEPFDLADSTESLCRRPEASSSLRPGRALHRGPRGRPWRESSGRRASR